jgi:hypothetical protein
LAANKVADQAVKSRQFTADQESFDPPVSDDMIRQFRSDDPPIAVGQKARTAKKRTEGESQTRAPGFFSGTDTKPRAPSKKGANGAAREVAEAFGRFWAAYPKHVGKLAAEKAFAKALKLADAEALIAGAKRYAAERAGQDPKFTKNPATWLRDGCWTDEPAASANGPPIIDNVTGDIIEPPSSRRRNGYDHEETVEEGSARILRELEMEARDGH